MARLEWSEKAKKDLKKFDTELRRRIKKQAERIAENASSMKHDALKGKWKGFFKAYIMNKVYRLIYTMHDQNTRVIIARIIRRDHDYENEDPPEVD